MIPPSSLPFNLAPGENSIDGVDATAVVTASASILISTPGSGGVLSLSATAGAVGAEVTATGSGYQPNAQLPVTFEGTNLQIKSASIGFSTGSFITADVSGGIRFKFDVPRVPGGARKLNVGGVESSFTVNRALAVSKEKDIVADESITLTGTGFSADEGYLVSFNGSLYSHNGSVIGLTVPESNPLVSFSSNPAQAQNGNLVFTSGSNMRDFKTLADGSFVVTFKVPGVPFGTYTLSVVVDKGGTSPTVLGSAPVQTENPTSKSIITKPSGLTRLAHQELLAHAGRQMGDTTRHA